MVKDEICGTIHVPCKTSDPMLLYSADQEIIPSGTITIFFDKGRGGTLDVIVNKQTSFSLFKGQTRSITVKQLKSLEVICRGGELGFCTGKYHLNINYKIPRIKSKPEVRCFLTNQQGIPIAPFKPGAISYEEISQPDERKNVTSKLPNGKDVSLQKVKVLEKGFVVIEVSCEDQIYQTKPIPFTVIETFILYAPSGAVIQCEITDFECDVILIDRTKTKSYPMFELHIFINLRQNLFTEAPVKLEVDGYICQPREE
ncbi:DUF3992 domain-containing protein [Aneurinibacillus migulanus]|nr:S-Ena type endospore appendage [Aneurinibacillus migulanus]